MARTHLRGTTYSLGKFGGYDVFAYGLGRDKGYRVEGHGIRTFYAGTLALAERKLAAMKHTRPNNPALIAALPLISGAIGKAAESARLPDSAFSPPTRSKRRRLNPVNKCSDCNVRGATSWEYSKYLPKWALGTRLGFSPDMQVESRQWNAFRLQPDTPREVWCDQCAGHRSEYHATTIAFWIYNGQDPGTGEESYELSLRMGTAPGLVTHPSGECAVKDTSVLPNPTAIHYRMANGSLYCGLSAAHGGSHGTRDWNKVTCERCLRAKPRENGVPWYSRILVSGTQRQAEDAADARGIVHSDGETSRQFGKSFTAMTVPDYAERELERWYDESARRSGPGLLLSYTVPQRRTLGNPHLMLITGNPPEHECSWCIAELGRKPTPGASHGICARHYRELIGEDPPAGVVGPRDLVLTTTGNPPSAALERAWCRFHQRDRFDGDVRDVGPIPGAPGYAFALGRLKAIDFGSGDCELSGGGVWVTCTPDTEALWIVSEREPMDFGKLSGKSVHALTYDPMRSSGKEPAYYRHDFKRPLPTVAPVGRSKSCRAVLLDGGRYKVTDWIRD